MLTNAITFASTFSSAARIRAPMAAPAGPAGTAFTVPADLATRAKCAKVSALLIRAKTRIPKYICKAADADYLRDAGRQAGRRMPRN